MKNYKCKYISRGHYIYRGIEIKCLGYYSPDKKITWEGNIIGESEGSYHGFSLEEIKNEIDEDLDKYNNFEHCSYCKHFFSSSNNNQMYCKYLKKGISDRKICEGFWLNDSYKK